MATHEPEDPTAGQVAMAFVLPPEDQWSEHFKLGFKDSKSLLPPRIRSAFAHGDASWNEYVLGYQHGINLRVREGTISVNRARKLLGFPKEPVDEVEEGSLVDAGATVEISDVRPRNDDFSYMQGKAHGSVGAKPKPGAFVNLDEYWKGYNDGLGERLQDGSISANQARDLLSLWKRDGEPIPAEPVFDAVKIPQHYNTGQIEVANFIADQDLAYPADNIIKYVVRAGKKDPKKKLEDIEKAAAYLQMMHNLANGLPAVVRDPETREVVWSLFRN